MWCKRHASTDATRAEPWKGRIQSHEQLMRAMFGVCLVCGREATTEAGLDLPTAACRLVPIQILSTSAECCNPTAPIKSVSFAEIHS